MNAKALSRSLAAAQLAAEERLLPKMQKVYANALRGIAADARTSFLALTADAWQPPPEGTVLTAAAIVELERELNEALAPLWAEALTDTAKAPLARIGIVWNIHHPLAAGQIEAVGTRLGAKVTEAVEPLIRDTLAAAWERGLSVGETARALAVTLEDAADWQAEMLARTDLAALANGASHAAATLAEVPFKVWLTAGDDKVRPEHVAADGQTVPLNEPFVVGGEEAEYPGDPALSDAMAINCRCTITYSDSLQAAGGGNMKPVKNKSVKRGIDFSALTADARPMGFSGVATVEGRLSDDNTDMPRVILPNALSWPELPLSFMVQTVTAEGHDGAEVAGRVDGFTRRKMTGRQYAIEVTGALTTPFGLDSVAPMLADQTMRYVSADLGATEWAVVDRDSFKVVPQEDLSVEDLMAGKYAMGLTAGKMKALTLLPTQAIEGALVALTASSASRSATLTFPITLVEEAALVAAAAPTLPPAPWFATAEPPGKMPLTVTEDGRVYGHLATWDACHVGFLPQCVPPPHSSSNYAYFHVCELDTDGGDIVTVGKLMFSPSDGGHANRSISAQRASAYYDKTGMVAAYLRVVDGEHGIWAAGCVNPDLSAEQRTTMRRELRLHPPSGDWRPINGNYELICGLAVAVPGFPVPRATVTVVASADGAELDGHDAIIASSGWFEPEAAALRALAEQGLLDKDAEAARRVRVLAVRAQGMDALAEMAR